jgi:hypothetical protein
VPADLDTLLIALCVFAHEVLARRPRARRRPQITDAQRVCLADAQIRLDIPSERHVLRFANSRLAHLFPYLSKQPGYNKRMRALAPQIVRLLNTLAFSPPSWCDPIRLLDSTPSLAAPPARPSNALSSPAMPPTATAPATAAILGFPALSALRLRRDADRLRARARQRPGTRGRRRTARPRRARRLHRDRRQGSPAKSMSRTDIPRAYSAMIR